MPPQNTTPERQDNEKKSWKEANRIRKAQRKKWKEEKALKKAAKLLPLEDLSEKTNDDVISDIQNEKVVEKAEVKDVSTLTLAVPGSILDNAQSQELQSYLAGQIARAACIFQIDEIVVFDDGASKSKEKTVLDYSIGEVKTKRCCVKLGRILQYLECPQYLRKHFFPIHSDLQYAGILNPLDSPHHLRQDNTFHFREGVVTNKPVKLGQGSFVNVGLKFDVLINQRLEPGLRCTVKLNPASKMSRKLTGAAVTPATPRKETGVYWGYTVRLANSLKEVIALCPYKDGYDLTIGTSDKGQSVDDFSCPKYNHGLVIFGGLDGLEAALEAEEFMDIDDPALLFDHYINVLPEQGSRTIRTEEAILVTMSALRSKLNPKHKPRHFDHKFEVLPARIPHKRKYRDASDSGPNPTDASSSSAGEESEGLSRFD